MPPPLRKVRIVYTGDERDQYGMPSPYHSYLVVAGESQVAPPGVAPFVTNVASIVPVSGVAPPPLQAMHVAASPDEALTAAERHLDALHGDLRKISTQTGDIQPSLPLVETWLGFLFPRLISSLGQEEYLLGQFNPSWRFSRGQCEFIRPVKEYVDLSSQAILDQFIRINGGFGELVLRHDRVLSDLESEAATFHRNLVAEPALVQLVEEIERRFEGWRGAYRQEHGVSLLAEMAVNWHHIPDPIGHTSTDAWKENRARVLEIIAESRSLTEIRRALEAAMRTAGEVANVVHRDITSMRDALADEFGLPAKILAFSPPQYETF